MNPWAHALRKEENESGLDTSAELLGTSVERLIVYLHVSNTANS